MGKIKSFFSVDYQYKEQVRDYTRTDGVICAVYYVIFMITYYFMGKLYLSKKIYLGVGINLLLASMCILIVLFRKQKLSSLGITKYKLKSSLVLGSFLGIIFLVFNGIIISLFSNSRFSTFNILYNVFYFFVIIGFVEELIFRGFIQTRIYGIIKNDFWAITLTGIMFSLSHIPFQMSMANMGAYQYFTENKIQFVVFFAWHIILNFLYKKYNSVYTGTVFHGFINLSSSLFR